jgi:7-keto-8-aminopelargonate synthetase-like enzyme
MAVVSTPLLIIKHQRKIMLASLGKAFGLTGGVIASDSSLSKQIAVLCRAWE